MALWLVRAGSHGEHEKKFLEDSRIYLTWDGLDDDLSKINSYDSVKEVLADTYPDLSKNAIINHGSQVWAFISRIKQGDWVALPSKSKPAIHIAEVKGDYTHNPSGPDPYYHFRKIKWIAKDIPRSNFEQDLLYSLGAFMTICQIQRNDAEHRIKKMAENRWRVQQFDSIYTNGIESEDSTLDEQGATDLEQISKDQIAKYILAKFKGHGMARLVDGILQAQGYTTYLSPEGPDKGIDLLAAPGALGFGTPRICVQVKSSDTPIDRPTLDQLIGTMQNVQAEQGLLVSWGGFKSSVNKEEASQFFRVRLWDQEDLVDQLLRNYDNLDEELKAELPMKRIWTMALAE